MSEPLDWSEDGPRSPRFGDVYFSTVDGLAESRAVFLAGCGLPEAWAGRDHFTVAELGFGTGLNILALVDLWRRTRAPGARLHVFSVEAYPIARDEAARALAAWPELTDLAEPLLAQWPRGRRGLHRIDFPHGAVLDLAVADATEAVEQWDGAADAWFLDGFAPARNPEMWGEALLALVAARSAPGARAATFTVAGAVRRGLQAAGFAVEKRPGFGRKRERLEARLPGEPRPEPPARVAIIGGGIAGASLARGVSALGGQATVFEAAAPGAGASGNPAALVTPRLDAGLGPVARLHAQAFARAVRLYETETPEAIIAKGALQLTRNDRDPGRFARLAAWDGFDPGALVTLGEGGIAVGLDEAPSKPGLAIREALVVEPAPLLKGWLARAAGVGARITRLERIGDVWRLFDEAGGMVGEAETVAIAAGFDSRRLAPLPLQPVRGQVSWTEIAFDGVAAAWGGYAIQTRRGTLFGATHDRDDAGTDLRAEDHARNRELLARGRPRFAERLDEDAIRGRASVRAATPDHLPLAGALGAGLFVLSGLGGRGFTLAPLLAEQVAALALGAPRPLPRPLAALVEPARFAALEPRAPRVSLAGEG